MSVNLGTARGVITIDANPFNQGLQAAAGNLTAFYQRSQTVGFGLNTLGRTFLAAGGAIAAGLGGAIKLATDFDEALRNVGAISDEVNANLQGTADKLLEIASIQARDPTELANALYQVVSAGIAAGPALDIVTVAAKAANAGLTTTTVAAKAITSVLNAGMKDAQGNLLDAASAADFLFTMVDRGVFTFEQLAQQIGDNTALAAQLGLSIEDLGAAYITLTQIGVPVAEAATQINAILNSLLKPSDEVTANLAEMGLTTDDLIAALSTEDGLGNVLQIVNELTKGEAADIDKLSGNIRAIKGILGLTTDAGKKYAESRRQMADADGRLNEVLAKQRKSIAFALRDLSTQVRIFAIRVGNDLAPAVTFVAKVLRQVVAAFNEIPAPLRQVGVIIAGITAAFLLLGGVGAIIAGHIVSIGSALRILALEGALVVQPFKLLLAPVLLATRAISAFGIAVFGLLSPFRILGAAIGLLVSPLRLLISALALVLNPLTLISAAFTVLASALGGAIGILLAGAAAVAGLGAAIAIVAVGIGVFQKIADELDPLITQLQNLVALVPFITEFFGFEAGTKHVKENSKALDENRRKLRDQIAEALGIETKFKPPPGARANAGAMGGILPPDRKGDVKDLKALDKALKGAGKEVRSWHNKFAIGRRALGDFFDVVGDDTKLGQLATFEERLQDVFGPEAGEDVFQATLKMRNAFSDLNDALSERFGIDNVLSLKGATLLALNAFTGLSQFARTVLVPALGEVLATTLDLAAGFTDLAANIISGDFSGALDALRDIGGTLIDQVVIPIGEVIIDVGRWVVTSLGNIYESLKRFVFDALTGTTRGSAQAQANAGAMGGTLESADATVPLSVVGIEILKWAVEQGENLWSAIRKKILEWAFGKDSGQMLGGPGGTSGEAAIGQGPDHTIPEVGVKILSWLVEQGDTLFARISEKVLAWAFGDEASGQAKANAGAMGGTLGRSGGAVHEVAGITVSLGGWILEQADNLFSAIAAKVMAWAFGEEGAAGDVPAGARMGGPAGGSGGGGGAVHKVTGLTISVGGWVLVQAGNLFADIARKVQEWAFGSEGGGDVPAGARMGGPVGQGSGGAVHRVIGLTVSLGGWIIQQAGDLFADITAKVQAWAFGSEGGGDVPAGARMGGPVGGGSGGAVHEVTGLIVSLSQWVVQEGESLWSAIEAKVSGFASGGGDAGLGAVPLGGGAVVSGGDAHEITDVPIRILKWAVSAAETVFSAVEKFLTGIGVGAATQVGGIAGAVIGAAVAGPVGALLGAVSGFVLVEIAEWAITSPDDLFAKVGVFVDTTWNLIKDVGHVLEGAVKVIVQDFEVVGPGKQADLGAVPLGGGAAFGRPGEKGSLGDRIQEFLDRQIAALAGAPLVMSPQTQADLTTRIAHFTQGIVEPIIRGLLDGLLIALPLIAIRVVPIGVQIAAAVVTGITLGLGLALFSGSQQFADDVNRLIGHRLLGVDVIDAVWERLQGSGTQWFILGQRIIGFVWDQIQAGTASFGTAPAAGIGAGIGGPTPGATVEKGIGDRLRDFFFGEGSFLGDMADAAGWVADNFPNLFEIGQNVASAVWDFLADGVRFGIAHPFGANFGDKGGPAIPPAVVAGAMGFAPGALPDEASFSDQIRGLFGDLDFSDIVAPVWPDWMSTDAFLDPPRQAIASLRKFVGDILEGGNPLDDIIKLFTGQPASAAGGKAPEIDESVASNLFTLAGSIDEAVKRLQEAPEKIRAAMQGVIDAFTTPTPAVGAMGQPGGEAITDQLKTLGTSVVTSMAEGIDAGVQAGTLSTSMSGLRTKITEGINALTTKGGEGSLDLAGAKIVTSLATGITEGVDEITTATTAITDAIFVVIQGFLQTATDMGAEIIDNFTVEGLIGGASIGKVTASIQAITTIIFTTLQTFLPTATDMGTETGDNYGSAIDATGDAVAAAAGNVVAGALASFQAGIGPAGEDGASTGFSYAAGVGSAADSAAIEAGNVVAAALSSFQAGGDAAFSDGANIGSSFAAGVASQAGAAASAGAALASAAAGGTASEAQTGSPSKVFIKLGKFVGLGFALGIKSTDHLIDAAARGMVKLPLVDSRHRGSFVPVATTSTEVVAAGSAVTMHGVTFVMPELRTVDAVAQYMTTLG